MNDSLSENEISYKVIGAALKIHKALGPGLLESVYETALEHDLLEIGLNVQKQVGLPFNYNGVQLEKGFRIDLIVNNKVVVEIKSVEQITPIHFSQTLTYLKLSNLKLALLLNFNTPKLKDGITRIVNKI